MRVTAFFSVVLFSCAGVAHAALGGAPDPFGGEATSLVSSVSPAAPNVTLRTTTLGTGTQVREYVSEAGLVFAVAWEGPFLPDLKVLLGRYFDAMVAESARLPRAGRSGIAISLPEVVINSGGHMRSFEGSAWLPKEFPPGFSADHVR
jgi:hypothetical protein